MIPIHPSLELHSLCPADNSALVITDVLIPGMHCLAEASCPKCHTRYYVELPVSHGIKSPLLINKATHEVIDPHNTSWLSRSLREGVQNPISEHLSPTVHKFFHADRIIIVNCLDFLYGHSLLKLLNVQRHLDNSPDLGVCVLAPPPLVHLVPEGVAEIWEFPVKVPEGAKWYTGLEQWIRQEIEKREQVFLSKAYSHPSNQVYDLNRFVQDLPDITGDTSTHEPIIFFAYREDRLWGPTLKHQEQKLRRLHNRLQQIFPDILFVIGGFGTSIPISSQTPSIKDLRCTEFNRDTDRNWLAYMGASDCALGVHGSNMLLPSGLSKATLELLPRNRLGNIYQDILFPHYLSDLRETLLRYRFLYGNDTLSDISTSAVARIIASMLLHNDQLDSWFKAGEGSSADFSWALSPVQQRALDYLNREKTAAPTTKEEVRARMESFFFEGLHLLDIHQDDS